jgi:hypothetical protein
MKTRIIKYTYCNGRFTGYLVQQKILFFWLNRTEYWEGGEPYFVPRESFNTLTDAEHFSMELRKKKPADTRRAVRYDRK